MNPVDFIYSGRLLLIKIALKNQLKMRGLGRAAAFHNGFEDSGRVVYRAGDLNRGYRIGSGEILSFDVVFWDSGLSGRGKGRYGMDVGAGKKGGMAAPCRKMARYCFNGGGCDDILYTNAGKISYGASAVLDSGRKGDGGVS